MNDISSKRRPHVCKKLLLMSARMRDTPNSVSASPDLLSAPHKSDEAIPPLTHTPRSLRRHHEDSDCRHPADLDVFHMCRQEGDASRRRRVFAMLMSLLHAAGILWHCLFPPPHLSAHRTSSSSPRRRVQSGCTDWSIHLKRFSFKGNKLCICFCCCADFIPSMIKLQE